MTKFSTLLVIAAAATCVAAPSLAQPSQISPVDVSAKPATTIAISLRGKDAATVRQDIRVAANTVCRNAVTNYEISFVDQTWCADTASYKANKTYDRLARDHLLADSGTIVLAAR